MYISGFAWMLFAVQSNLDLDLTNVVPLASGC